ncbi:Gfo/Idh/MocA family protein [Vagococcus sp.]|uniref:Gfo/Idh/MocA family protein n=1 Tax=Vagococcus sp. TaxID=1933889 RepID=UPI003F9744E5
MLNLGIVGTNWITHQFVEAALASGAYQLKGVYSRSVKKAQKFSDHYENQEESLITDQLETLFHSDQIDVLYIASPNSLHYQQAEQAIRAGKHVIVEKPMASNSTELNELVELAEEKEVFIFEAARHIHEENFKKVTSLLKTRDDVVGANLTFMKYSSRYDAVLRGEEPNIFSPKYSGGALMDLGVYLVYAAISWFGYPEDALYFNQKLTTGVDGIGMMIFRYPTFDVTMQTGKHADSQLPSEIYLSDGTLILDAINSIEKITMIEREKDKKVVIEHATDVLENPMVAEALAFSQVINHPLGVEEQKNYQEWIQLAKDVHEVMTHMRKTSDILFEADQ